jgi:hypothetical protein
MESVYRLSSLPQAHPVRHNGSMDDGACKNCFDPSRGGEGK